VGVVAVLSSFVDQVVGLVYFVAYTVVKMDQADTFLALEEDILGPCFACPSIAYLVAFVDYSRSVSVVAAVGGVIVGGEAIAEQGVCYNWETHAEATVVVEAVATSDFAE